MTMKFTDTVGNVLSALELRAEGKTTIRLAGASGNPSQPPTIEADNRNVVMVGKPRLFDGPKGIWNILVSAKNVGKAQLQVRGAGLKLPVTIVARITLAAPSAKEGILVRVFLAETKNPGQRGYSLDDAKTAMEWMKRVIENRRTHPTPGDFNIQPVGSGVTVFDVLKAPGQFAGFQHAPILDAGVSTRIQKILENANNDALANRADYAAYVEAAIKIATGSTIADPSKRGLIGWRTKDSGSPGGNFIAYGSPISGNQFFTWPPLPKGQAVEVITSDGLNVREAPKSKGAFVVKLRTGDTAYVAKGSATEADGYSWLQLSKNQKLLGHDISEKWIAQFKISPRENYIKPTL